MVWLVTILNSVGGLCISLVMKYADNVMKTYCQSIAIGKCENALQREFIDFLSQNIFSAGFLKFSQ